MIFSHWREHLNYNFLGLLTFWSNSALFTPTSCTAEIFENHRISSIEQTGHSAQDGADMHGAKGIEKWGKSIHARIVTNSVTQSRKKSHSLELTRRFSYTHLDFLHVHFAPNQQTKLLQRKAYTSSSREWIRRDAVHLATQTIAPAQQNTNAKHSMRWSGVWHFISGFFRSKRLRFDDTLESIGLGRSESDELFRMI
jgi:hypothetical protein